MPFIAWVLFALLALQGGVGVANMIANPGPKATPGTTVISVLLTIAVYVGLLSIVVRLATT